ncbi:MAG: ABC transporter ATP-binding protein, partial [Pseudomonadota bacterium]|nr:ABC transporter ATP-binding protein [Pseudomonadota bacterium]
MTPLLKIEGLTVSLPAGADRPVAVDNVSLTINRNEIVSLVGESGSGKSMIAHAILGLLPRKVHATAGTIRFEGQDLLALKPAQLRGLRGARISMIFQEPLSALNPLRTVGRQVGETITIHDDSVSASDVRDRVQELFEQVGLPDPERLRDAYPFQLSGGQRQRVMIAMALANNPDLLIADEPTTALDVTTQRQILDLIQRLQAERGMGVLFITHDIGVVADIADRVVVLRHGKLLEEGPRDAVLTAPKDPYTRMLLDAVPGRGSLRDGAEKGRPLIEVRDLQKAFSTRSGMFAPLRVVKASDGVSMTLRQGETVAVVGESGSGKSTLARLILGLIEPDSGKVLFDGKPVLQQGRAALRDYRRRVQIIFQDPFSSLDPRVKVGESIVRGPMAFGKPRAQSVTEAKSWLTRVGLDAAAFDRFPHEFSGGQRQRVCIARALALEPRVLIADEAVSAL